MYRKVCIMVITSLVSLAAVFAIFTSEGKAAPPKACPKSPNGLIGRDNPEKAFNFFLAKGLTPIQSAAIVGNLMQEAAGVNPRRVNSIGAKGIAQWLHGRKTRLYQYARNRKLNVNHLRTQLLFIWHEFDTTEELAFKKLKSHSSLSGATLSVRVWYERPASWEAMDANRLRNAKQVLAKGRATGFCGLVKGVKAPAPVERPQRRPNQDQQEEPGLGQLIGGSKSQDEQLMKAALGIGVILLLWLFFKPRSRKD